ncbi:hypothetical protein IV454_29810 [Massilia antarctica]|uniref:Chemotaxis protein n=1 Tax=Massilia antarctica TaxID=2765360 RepID=A0AA49A7M6_9BURK|nr:hypothetical protein [Massilia antarctica]QPI49578.1 hypothetical protein IV454_29810 [Massilia antarctica]
MTGTSTLDPDNFPETPDRKLGSGHGTGALGPSDSSDSGSDLVGASGLARDDVLDLGSGTTSDLETGTAGGAGPDVGDPDLDSDTDASGTGERAAAGRDTTVRDGADIDVDHIESIPSVPLDEDDLEFMASAPPGQAPGGKKGAHP